MCFTYSVFWRVSLMRVEYFNTGLMESDVTLRYCGYEETTADFFSLPIIRDCYLLHYISRGEGFYMARGKTYNLKAGDIFCIFPKEAVSYYAKKENPWFLHWFSYNGRKALEFTSRIGFSESSPVQSVTSGNRFTELMDDLLQTFKSVKQPQEFILLHYLYSLFSVLECSYIATGYKPVVNKSSVYIEKAIQFIAYNYNRSITIQEISGYIGLNRTYFSKLFGRIMGSSPQNYLLKFRLQKSQSLLREANLSISEVGRAVGLENPFYFSRVFKLYTGVSPSIYRNSLNHEISE